jgi:hypothetical protein
MRMPDKLRYSQSENPAYNPMQMLMILDSLAARLPSGSELAAFMVVVCFAAGLNVYATVGILGLFSHAGVVTLPQQLHALQNWYIIVACSVLFALEFVGDKIPVFDVVWNAMQTFVRIPVAGLIAFAATSQLPEWERLAATLIGALIALAAHGGKTAARAAVMHSPEPFSNVALSLGEDATVALLLWFATHHPFAAAGIVAVMIAAIVVMARVVIRAMRALFSASQKRVAGHAS